MHLINAIPTLTPGPNLNFSLSTQKEIFYFLNNILFLKYFLQAPVCCIIQSFFFVCFVPYKQTFSFCLTAQKLFFFRSKMIFWCSSQQVWLSLSSEWAGVCGLSCCTVLAGFHRLNSFPAVWQMTLSAWWLPSTHKVPLRSSISKQTINP